MLTMVESTNLVPIYEFRTDGFIPPVGVKKLDSLLRRSLEVIEPQLPKDWRAVNIKYDRSGNLSILVNGKDHISPGIYSKGYLKIFFNKILGEAQGNYRELKFHASKTITDDASLEYSVVIGY